MLVAGLAFVGRYGSNVPSWDEWDMVPTLTGAQPVTLAWLWSQHSEHRLPLPRLVILTLNWIFGCDFRVCMYGNVVALGLLALGLILMAARRRGHVSLADAFFPLALLHWGHASNFLWGWQMTQILPTVLAGAILMVILREDRLHSRTSLVLAGLCVVLLPLCGANGVAFGPALTFWLAFLALAFFRSGTAHGRRTGWLAGVLAALAGFLTVAYFVGYQVVPYHPVSSGWRGSLRASLQFISLCFGPALDTTWKWAGLAMLGLCLGSGLLLVLVGRWQPLERRRVGAFLLFFTAMGCLTLGIGWGRSSAGLEPRYAVFIVPLGCGVYFIWSLYGPGAWNRLIRYGLCGAMGLLLWSHTQAGMAYGTTLRGVLSSFERDVRAGVAPYLLIHRYANYLHPHHDLIGDYLPLLARAGVGNFRYLQSNPAFREVSLPLVPSRVREGTWNEGQFSTTGPSSALVFTLPTARYVGIVRLRYSYADHPDALTFVSCYWKPDAETEFSYNHYSKYSPTGDAANWALGTWCRLGQAERIFTVCVCDRVKEIRIQPDFKPCVCRIAEIALLVPPEGEPVQKGSE
jgi:hypothetical protein